MLPSNEAVAMVTAVGDSMQDLVNAIHAKESLQEAEYNFRESVKTLHDYIYKLENR